MSGWILAFLIVTGVLFLVKIVYVVCTGLLLPLTQGGLFVGTPFPAIRAFLDAVPLSRGTLLVDLGCGDGRVLRAARKRYGVRALGYEINPLAFCVAKLLCAGRKGIRVRYGNFWNAALGEVDVVFCYLFPDLMGRLAVKLKRELRPGSLVISGNFPLPGWKPREILRPETGRGHDPIFVYEISNRDGEGNATVKRDCRRRGFFLPPLPGKGTDRPG